MHSAALQKVRASMKVASLKKGMVDRS
jgi:hypothetical protein